MALELQRKCEQCQGYGSVDTPERQEWNGRFLEWYDAATPAQRLPRSPERLAWTKANPMPNRPREVPCLACDGTGTTLTRDGLAVAALVRRILKETDGRW